MSVDVLALHFDRSARRIVLGLTTRTWEPFRGEPALPGVLLGDGERLRDAATRALTGQRFPTADAVDITASLTGRAPDRGNLNRTLRGVPGLHRTDERVAARSTGRPAVVWEWDN